MLRGVPGEKNSKSKILAFAAIGNALELYDFTLFGVMLPILSPIFFPNEKYSMLLGFLAFAVTFFVSPFGSIFWGWYGDKFGRVRLLKNSILLMAFPSLAIACLPTYGSIGIVAPITLLFLRILQGISASGEVIGSKVFAMEYLGSRYYSISSGVISAAGALGVLFAMLVAYYASQDEGGIVWRFCFLFGSMLFIIAVLIRKSFAKSIQNRVSSRPADLSISLFKIIRRHPDYSVIVFTLGAILGVMSYLMHVFINPYLLGLGFQKPQISQLLIVALMVTGLSALIAGFLINSTTQLLKVIFSSTVIYSIFVIIVFKTFGKAYLTLILFIFLGGSLGAFATASAVIMYKCFPKEVRCRGLMVNYAFGCSYFGGMTPIALNSVAFFSHDMLGYIVSLTLLVLLIICQRSLKNVTLY